MTDKIVIEGYVHTHLEDDGCAMVAEGIDHDPSLEVGMFVRFQSWDEEKQHPVLSSLTGKKVRITVEVVD